MSTNTIPRYLTRDEVSSECFGGAIAPGRVIALVKQGLPAHRVGRRYMFVADEVDAWVRSRDSAVNGNNTDTEGETDGGGAAPVNPDWLAEQLARFTADDLRRAAEVLIALAGAAAA